MSARLFVTTLGTRTPLVALATGWLCALLLTLLLTLLLALPTPALGHETSVAHLLLNLDEAPFTGRLVLALEDVAAATPLDTNRDGQVTSAEVAGAEIAPLIEHGVQLVTTSGRCQTKVVRTNVATRATGASARAFRPTNSPVELQADLQFLCAHRNQPALHYALFADVDPSHRLALAYHIGGRTNNTWHTTHAASSDGAAGQEPTPTNFVALTGEPAVWRPFSAGGVQHVLAGADHLLFLATLLLPALFGGGRSEETTTPRRLLDAWPMARLGSIALVVTAFTLAHSVTLGVAALGVWQPPAGPIELLIALSIAVAAATNLRRHAVRPVTASVFVAAGFGLLHGFGFSNVLAPLGLPKGNELASLAAFNLGVEAGQLLFVAAAMAAAVLLSRIVAPPRLLVGGSVASLLIASFWIVERALLIT